MPKREGICHTDQRFKEKVNVDIVKDIETDDQIKDLLRRKRDYWKKHKKPGVDSDDEGHEDRRENPYGVKRKNNDDEKPLNKTAVRKKRKLEAATAKAREAKKLKQDQAQSKTNGNTISTTNIPKQTLNPNIRCSHHTIRPRPIASIKSFDHHKWTDPAGTTYTLPFNNINSRTTVRVIDFYPPNLQDFTTFIPARNSEYAVLSSASSDSFPSSQSSPTNSHPPPDSSQEPSSQHSRRKGTWQWRFALTLSDASSPSSSTISSTTTSKEPSSLPNTTTLTANLSDQDAVHLLKLDACDLHHNPTALSQLREKLFLLWGDLEERKSASASSLAATTTTTAHNSSNNDNSGNENKLRDPPLLLPPPPRNLPFECCIKEYGVKVRVGHRGSGSSGRTEARPPIIGEQQGKEDENGGGSVDVDICVTDPETEDESGWRWGEAVADVGVYDCMIWEVGGGACLVTGFVCWDWWWG